VVYRWLLPCTVPQRYMWPSYCMPLFFRGFECQVSDYFPLFEQSTSISLLVLMWVISLVMQGSSSNTHVGYSIKQPTRCTINFIFIVLSRRHSSTCFGHCCAHHQEPPPIAFAASGYRMIAGLDVLQSVVGLLVN
jgi:hypothetical protein